jgi:hypothetical protein
MILDFRLEIVDRGFEIVEVSMFPAAASLKTQSSTGFRLSGCFS